MSARYFFLLLAWNAASYTAESGNVFSFFRTPYGKNYPDGTEIQQGEPSLAVLAWSLEKAARKTVREGGMPIGFNVTSETIHHFLKSLGLGDYVPGAFKSKDAALYVHLKVLNWQTLYPCANDPLNVTLELVTAIAACLSDADWERLRYLLGDAISRPEATPSQKALLAAFLIEANREMFDPRKRAEFVALLKPSIASMNWEHFNTKPLLQALDRFAQS